MDELRADVKAISGELAPRRATIRFQFAILKSSEIRSRLTYTLAIIFDYFLGQYKYVLRPMTMVLNYYSVIFNDCPSTQ